MIDRKEKYICFDIETTGLNPWYGDRITCICAKDSNGNILKISDHSEMRILVKFTRFLVGKDDYTLITKNGKHFDIPFILTRFSFHSYPVITYANKLTKMNHNDLHLITKKWISLDDMARLLSCTPKNGRGSDAIDLWYKKDIEKLKKYCMQDVDTTLEVYQKYMQLQNKCEVERMVDTKKALENKFLNVSIVKESKSKLIKIIAEAKFEKNTFDNNKEDNLVVPIMIDGQKMKWNVNTKTIENIHKVYGVDSLEWIGKELNLTIEKANNGKDSIVGTPVI